MRIIKRICPLIVFVAMSCLLSACGKGEDGQRGRDGESGEGETRLPPTKTVKSSDIVYSDAETDQQNIAWANEHLNSALEKKRFAASNGMEMPYRLFTPENTEQDKKYPLLVFLHGRGDRGSDNRADMFDSVGLFTGPQSIVSPNMQEKYPSFVLIPQCSDSRPDEEWARAVGNTPEAPFKGLGDDGHYQQHPEASTSGAAALELIEKTIANYAVDSNRVYITGVSMGGFGTWEFISRRPDLFAAAVPMAGYSDPSKARQIAHIPIWIFHGDQDEYNPVEGSRNMAQLLGSLGAEVRYSELSGYKHVESFREAWKNRQIIPWLFSKERQSK